MGGEVCLRQLPGLALELLSHVSLKLLAPSKVLLTVYPLDDQSIDRNPCCICAMP